MSQLATARTQVRPAPRRATAPAPRRLRVVAPPVSAGSGAFLALCIGLVVAGFVYAVRNNLGGLGAFVHRVWGKIRLGFDALVQLFEQGGFSGAVMAELGRAENSGLKRFLISVYQVAFRVGRDGRTLVAALLIGFALIVYPLWSLAVGQRWPAFVTFGLPCPTTIFTIGLLWTATAPLPRSVLLAPPCTTLNEFWCSGLGSKQIVASPPSNFCSSKPSSSTKGMWTENFTQPPVMTETPPSTASRT